MVDTKPLKGEVREKKKELTHDRIKELEDELKKTCYNKKTQHHVGLVKAKLAMLKDKEQARVAKSGKGAGYTVKKSGDATVILVGFPSCGKSSLLNALTNANSPVGAYEFTTLSVIPGLLEYKDAKIQVLDVPGIVMGAASGKGRGREVLSVMQNADLAIIMVDVLRPNAFKVIMQEVYDAHLRLNKVKPDIRLKKTAKSGVMIGKTVPLPDLTDEMIKSICKEMRINNAEVLIRSVAGVDDFIDAIEANKVYIPGITVLSKIDLVDISRLEEIKREIKPDISLSVEQNINIEELKELIFQRLKFIRVFCKETGKKADLEKPMIMQNGSTVETMCNKLHRDFITKFRFARIWGKSAKFPGQRLMLNHKLADGDVVQINLK